MRRFSSVGGYISACRKAVSTRGAREHSAERLRRSRLACRDDKEEGKRGYAILELI